MPPTCSICRHPEREAIDAALVAGESFRNIAQRFGPSATALHRHKSEHVAVAMAKATEAETVAADDLLAQVGMLQTKALGILNRAEAAGSLNVALMAIREARGNVELLAKLTHQLSDRPTVNVLVAAEWLQVRAVLLEALSPYPAARAAVSARLNGLEVTDVGD